MKGSWTGYYKYNKEWIQQAVGYEKTGFTMNIHLSDNKTFEGSVNDDIATGGMHGTGMIKGTINGNKITFKKFMPEGSLINPDGSHVTTNRVHNTLHYSGKLVNDCQYSGDWKFRVKIGFILGFIPFPYCPGNGTWFMEKNE